MLTDQSVSYTIVGYHTKTVIAKLFPAVSTGILTIDLTALVTSLNNIAILQTAT